MINERITTFPASDEDEHRLVILGNPGTGKSTLLNSMIGSVQFASGFSAGTGMTQSCASFHDPNKNIFYFDTPGLDDVQIREQAAGEIEKVFRSKKASYKLVFVVTLEAGRVRAADVVTMKLILRALPAKSPHGVIVNKVSPSQARKLRSPDSEDEKKMHDSLSVCKTHKPEFLHILTRNDDLEDEDDQLLPETEEKKGLLAAMHALRPLTISPSDMGTIDVRSIDELKETVGELRKTNKKLTEMVGSQDSPSSEGVTGKDSQDDAEVAGLVDNQFAPSAEGATGKDGQEDEQVAGLLGAHGASGAREEASQEDEKAAGSVGNQVAPSPEGATGKGGREDAILVDAELLCNQQTVSAEEVMGKDCQEGAPSSKGATEKAGQDDAILADVELLVNQEASSAREVTGKDCQDDANLDTTRMAGKNL